MNGTELRRVDRASVWKAGKHAGWLLRTREGTQFEYLVDYAGPPIATTLPLGPGPVRLPAGAVPPFFSGLLPEGRRLGALRRATKTSLDDELTLLLAVGADTIGDVQVLPDRTTPAEQRTIDDVPESLANVTFAELFAGVLGPEQRDRVGLPGAQDKISGRLIALPVTHPRGEFLLKLDPPEVPHLVANEAFFLAAARASGIETAEATVLRDREGKVGLLVRRFDRAQSAAEPTRFAQEDACQVLGRYPADKYHLAVEEVMLGLARQTSAPIVSARTLLRQFAFAYLTGNGDAHGKNFSIVQRDGEWCLTPAYDLPSTLPYGDTTMALSIGGKDREDLGRADFVALGAACGVLPKAGERVLDELLAKAPSWLDRLGELPFDRRVIHKLSKACNYRLRRLGR